MRDQIIKLIQKCTKTGWNPDRLPYYIQEEIDDLEKEFIEVCESVEEWVSGK